MADFTYTPPGQNSPEHQKRMAIVMILMMGIIFIWSAYFSPPPPPPPPPEAAQQANIDAAPAQAAVSSGEAQAALQPAAVPAEESIPERKATFQTKAFDLAFSNAGGGISSAILKNSGEEWNNYKFEQLFKLESGKEIRPVDLAAVEAGQNLPGSCEISGDSHLPFSARFSMEERTNGVTFRGGNADVALEKTFDFSDDGYDFRGSYKVTNRSSSEKRLRLSIAYPAFYDPKLVPKGSLFAPPPDQIQAMLLDDGDAERLQAGKSNEEKTFKGPIQFAGFDQRYFLGAVFPADQRGTSGRIAASPNGRYEAVLTFDLGPVAAGQSVTRDVGFFIGPKSNDLLKKVSEAARRGTLVSKMNTGASSASFADPRLAESIDFGWWAVICRALLAVLKFFEGITHNWGAAIILLTVMVKLILFPLNQKQMASMEAMRRIQPQLQELQKKYANDREKLGMEQMKLFQEAHANPFGGCLPLLVQMPVWFALYRTLYSSFELYREPLLSVWITDLTQADPFYILPLAMGVTMFITQKMQPQMGDPKQARMMLYFMPVFFTFLMANLPAGLTLYIFTNNLLSIGQQALLRRKFSTGSAGGSASSAVIAVSPTDKKENEKKQ